MTVVDATCPDVTRTHDLIREKAEDGYEIIYIGKKGHPEPEGAVGIAPDHVHLIETEEEIQTACSWTQRAHRHYESNDDEPMGH